MATQEQWLTRDLCKRLAEARLEEARKLLEAGLSPGAYYIAGYARARVERRYKPAFQTGRYPLPEVRERGLLP